MSTTTLPKPGTVMPDGSIYAGVSPKTGGPIYTTPKDAPLLCDFNEAAKYASKLDAHGNKDWRVPSKAELNVVFQNMSEIGGFDLLRTCPAGWYVSSSQIDANLAWAQNFSSGVQSYYPAGLPTALRCVRG